jgi:ubiquinone/menaquinone biosynthesis C-methylase UbiE
MSAAAGVVDWSSWLRRWDAQQSIYAERERRFEAMLDLLGKLLPPDFVAVDLACGPGSLSQRVLTRFPQARAIAVDLDPVLLAMGRGALGDMGGRLSWLEADLRDPSWSATLPDQSAHAVLSTTALHWLPVADLFATYRAAYRVLVPGGVLLNGDRFRLPESRATLQRVLRELADERREREGGAAETWEQWWKAIGEVPELSSLLAERERRFSWFSNAPQPVYEVHPAALIDAGFSEVDVVWQHHDARILAALKR